MHPPEADSCFETSCAPSRLLFSLTLRNLEPFCEPGRLGPSKKVLEVRARSTLAETASAPKGLSAAVATKHLARTFARLSGPI